MNLDSPRKPESITEYINAAPKEVQKKLREMHACLGKAAPGAKEGIERGVPAFSYKGVLFTFAARKNHISFNPTPSAVRAFTKELSKFETSSTTIRFPLDKPLPLDLIRKIAAFRVRDAKNHWQVLRNSEEHKQLALKAADKAEQVLQMFEEEHPTDKRPREAIEALRAWACGKRELGMVEVRKLSLDSHAAAREARTDAARFAARAAGHAIATWHVPSHAQGVEEYAIKARKAAMS